MADAKRKPDSEPLPAGLDERDPALESAPEAKPTGERADRRTSPPGTSRPGAPAPASAGAEQRYIADEGDGEED